MNKPSFFYIWLMLLAVGLMCIITVTQYVTKKSQIALEESNKQAAITFSLNNRLEELTNLSFSLENRLTNKKEIDVKYFNGIKDSLTQLGYNTNVLKNVLINKSQFSEFKRISVFINEQVDISFKILSDKKVKSISFKDSLTNLHLADSVYVNAIVFQKRLEKLLSQNLFENNITATKLARLNFLLAIVSLLAVVFLVSIIIKRQKKQLQLITDLNISREAALQSGIVKDRFLANMSHEIRTPLNALKGFSELLWQTKLDDNQHKFTGIIKTASENLLNIVNDILDFSKIESDTITLKQYAFSIVSIMNEMQNMFEHQAHQKNIVLNFEIDEDIPNTILGDAARLKQILINLISNAIKFTEAGSIKVRANIYTVNDKQLHIKFLIEDTGTGIPTDKLDSIFERFEQVDNSFSRKQGGTGLGLAIAKKLVSIMEGSIEVKSAINLGTTFTLILPFEKQRIDINTTVQTLEILQINFTNKNILLVEDNYMNQILVQSIFEKYGIAPIIANNGIQALEILGNTKIDIILMDVQMPNMDGIEATEIIRKKYGNTIPIIAMTAHVLEQEKMRCINAGMNEYLTKPISEALLIETLNNFLGTNEEVKTTINNLSSNNYFSYLSIICNGDEPKMKIILKALHLQIEKEMGDLVEILKNKNLEELKKCIHNFKSTLAPIDAEADVVKSILQFENYINNQNSWDEINIAAKEVSKQLLHCKKIIENAL